MVSMQFRLQLFFPECYMTGLCAFFVFLATLLSILERHQPQRGIKVMMRSPSAAREGKRDKPIIPSIRCYIYLHIEKSVTRKPHNRIVFWFFGICNQGFNSFPFSIHFTSHKGSPIFTFLFITLGGISFAPGGTVSVVPVTLTDKSRPYRFFYNAWWMSHAACKGPRIWRPRYN